MPRHPLLAVSALLTAVVAATATGSAPVHAAPLPTRDAAASSAAAAAAAGNAFLAGGTRWAWPVNAERAVLRPFAAPAERWSSGHRGVDLHAPAGASALSPADGTVHFAGFIVDRPVLSIRHDDGLLSSFEPLESSLGAGDRVHRGAPIGVVTPGHCDQDCLHLGVRLDGEYISPMLLLGGLSRSVLLPTRAVP